MMAPGDLHEFGNRLLPCWQWLLNKTGATCGCIWDYDVKSLSYQKTLPSYLGWDVSGNRCFELCIGKRVRLIYFILRTTSTPARRADTGSPCNFPSKSLTFLRTLETDWIFPPKATQSSPLHWPGFHVWNRAYDYGLGNFARSFAHKWASITSSKHSSIICLSLSYVIISG